MRNGAVSPTTFIPAKISCARPAEATCPFCGQANTQNWAATRSEDGTLYQTERCQTCGTVFLWPSPSAAQLAQAYTTNYYGEGETKFNPYIERLRNACANLRVKKLTNGLPADATIMDVGCGDGRLLRNFKRTGFRKLHGIELPGRAAERTATIPDITLHLGTLASVELPAANFDLITLVHVYEHLPAPLDTLDQLARLIKPGGRLFLAFPNISSWQARFAGGHWFHLDPPRHLTLVPPQAVISYLKAKGFKLLSERHLCLEQNTYGWIQSALNRYDGQRNFLYERLKRNRTYLPDRSAGSFALHAGLGGLLLFPSLLADGVSALAKAGATVELMFEQTSPH